ncbi:MAG TPA: FAD-binding oxidoreductase [Actinomycetota bacterium]|jgi:FAD/FMN-containing dehydrogenase|nr:FAD-binding oxidoreductase [Actinomycetota bacterium]
MAGNGDVGTLRARITGPVFVPSDPGYEDARAVWNAAIDKHPAVIARCRSAEDVRAAIAFGREHGLPLAVRGGGHQVAGTGSIDDGLVIDLSELREVTVDPERRTVRAEGGARLGDLDRATQEHGLAVPVGVVSETGIAGLTLSGGMGHLRRLHGLSCDNLLSADMVTADGRVVTANEEEHPDLLWALRGGGANLGVVTAFTFRAFPVGPQVAFCFTLYPADRATGVLRGCVDLASSMPDAVSPLAFLGRVPQADAFPAEAVGEPFVAVLAPHPGPPEEGESVLRPLRELAEPIVDLSGRASWVEVQALLDEDYPNGLRYYWTSVELTGLSQGAIDRLRASADAAPSDLSTLDIWFQGGEMARVEPDATGFGDRSAPIMIGVEANWEDPELDEASISWARRCVRDLEPYSTGGTYLNFGGFLEGGEAQVRRAVGEANFERLAAVRGTYDPDGVFDRQRPAR